MYDQLISLCDRNREFFNKDKTDVGAHFQSSFKKISEFLLKSNQVLKQIKNFAGIYDFDEKTPGNGFRSFIFIFDAAVNYIDQTCKLIAEKKGKIFFRKGFYAKYGKQNILIKAKADAIKFTGKSTSAARWLRVCFKSAKV